MNIYRSLHAPMLFHLRRAARLPTLARCASTKAHVTPATAESSSKKDAVVAETPQPSKYTLNELLQLDLYTLTKAINQVDPKLAKQALRKRFDFVGRMPTGYLMYVREVCLKNKVTIDKVTSMYRSLDTQTKMYYNDLAQQEVEKREQRIREWCETAPRGLINAMFRLKLISKARRDLAPCIQRSVSAFGRFFAERRLRYISEHGGLNSPENNRKIMKLAKIEWDELPHPDKEVYYKASQQERENTGMVRAEHLKRVAEAAQEQRIKHAAEGLVESL